MLTPFFQVFLQEHVGSEIEEFSDPSTLPPSTLESIEADCYWCLKKLLDGIQDNYTHAQPGITRQVARLKELVSRVDGKHIKSSFHKLTFSSNSPISSAFSSTRRRIYPICISLDELPLDARNIS